MYCRVCKVNTEWHKHCENCGREIWIGEECYKAGNVYYCTDCCCSIELEEPERDWDFERKARLERMIEDA